MNNKGFTTIKLVISMFEILLLIGYLRCGYKLITCDFKAPYKAEVIYGGGLILGYGGIIGYINIEDK